MAQTKMMDVTIQELTKYGFKANDRYVGWSKNLDESAKIPVIPGRTFSMELYVADSGKEYVNKILKQVGEQNPSAKVDTVRAKKYTPKEAKTPVTVATGVVKTAEDKPMLRADWDAKDRRISRQGMLQACLQAVSPMYSDVNALFEAASELADKGLEYVNRT